MAKRKVALPGLFSRAAAAANSGDFDEADRLYRAVLAVRPGQPEAVLSLSVVRYQRGRHDEALLLIERLLVRRPDLAEAHYSRGTMLQNLGDFEAAVESFDKALALTPDDLHALQNRGASLATLKRFDEALASYDRLISIDRNSIDGHLGRGYVLSGLGRFAEALASYDRVLVLRPGNAIAHNTRGNMLSELRRYDEALASFDRALSLKPDYVEAHLNRGNALKDLGRYEEALASYDRVPTIGADDLPAALNSRGIVLQELRRFSEALECFDRAIELEPGNADFHSSRAVLLLLRGNFADGWRGYEWRRKQKIWRNGRFEGPEWKGEAVAGKRVFLYTEQGLGDAIQFARFARSVAEFGAEVSVGAPPRLDRLLRGLDAKVVIVGDGERLPNYDLHLPLMSVPLILGTTEATIPADVPYLSADPARLAIWGDRLRPEGGRLRVGFRWAGGSTFVGESHRSTTFERWRPVLQTPNICWYSLQTEDRAAEFSRLSTVAIRDLSAQLTDFTETAAVIANLDLVITTDTAVAHLAGALGRPVLIALKHVADWRWLLDREDFPWYPTARLFRQRRAGDLDEVIARVAAELDHLAASGREQPSRQPGRGMTGLGLFNVFGNRRGRPIV